MRKRITRILHLITTITTGTLIVCMGWYYLTFVLSGESITKATVPFLTLPEILSIGILCGISTELLLPQRESHTAEVWIRLILHYILINGIVLVCGYFYEWYSLNPQSVLLMCATSAGVYAFTFFQNYYKDKKTSDEMNEKLKRYGIPKKKE